MNLPFQLYKEQHTEPLLLRVPVETKAFKQMVNTLYNKYFSNAMPPQQQALPWALKVFCSRHYAAL